MRDRDLFAASALFAPATLFSVVLGWAHQSLYWGDLSYLHHPWRALAAQMIQQGHLPLWDPYAYFGMPFAAEMQCGAWYVGTQPFYLFPFASALSIFQVLHYGLAGFFSYLWLRSEGLSRAAAFAGAAAFMGCGSLVSRAPFLNHLSTLAFMPAFFLVRRSLPLLALAFSLSFFSGYPLMMAGGALMALVLPRMLGGSARGMKIWPGAAVLGAGLGACLLIPAIELTIRSHRGAGLGLEDTLLFGLRLSDWPQWISPIAALVLRPGEYSPSVSWWKTCYLGLFSWTAILLALPRLTVRARVCAAIVTLAVGCLLLGGSNPISLWFWSHLSPLRFVRYPGNLAYLLLPLLSLLVACGLHDRNWAPGFALALTCELVIYAAFSQPAMPSRDYTEAGLLVRELQREPEHRYLLSPNALHWHRGSGILDWRQRLYGLTNLPFRLSAAGNFGEPLVPTTNYDFIDLLFSREGLDGVAPYLKWSDVHWVMTRDRLPSRSLRYDGDILWHRYEAPGPVSKAAWFSDSDASEIPPGMVGSEKLPKLKPKFLTAIQPREDRLTIRASTDEGWIYLSEPAYPGWTARLDGRVISASPALGVFQKFRVPKGSWEFQWSYDPRSWTAGLLLSLTFLMGLMAYWYNRLRA